MIELITFDCAQTLVEVNWDIARFELAKATEVGIPATMEMGDQYRQLYMNRLDEFWRVNQSGSLDRYREFWIQLEGDWCICNGFDPNHATQLYEAGMKLGFELPSLLFKPFEDVSQCLKQLRESGKKLAVISNWDLSLHRVLDMFGWTQKFDMVIASLEFGVEKPAPEIFHHVLKRFGFAPNEALHVGDDAIDDLQGAKNAGMRGLLVDRDRKEPQLPFINSLLSLPKLIAGM